MTATPRPAAAGFYGLAADDPGRMAVVGLTDLWMDENRWDVYLPPGDYRLCVATRGIPGQGLAPARASAPIWPSLIRPP